jgi:hypothetical protein
VERLAFRFERGVVGNAPGIAGRDRSDGWVGKLLVFRDVPKGQTGPADQHDREDDQFERGDPHRGFFGFGQWGAPFCSKCGQTMARTGPLAGVAGFFELAAGGGSPFVNAASDLRAYCAGQRSTARWGVVGAAHARTGVVDVHCQAARHAAAVLVEFFH